MIRILCLNPVIDRMYEIDGFQAGTQFHGITPRCYPGGKGVNIARVMRCMGEECALYCFLGGTNGKAIEDEMRKYGVQLHAVWMAGETRTTVNIIDRSGGIETEITEPGSFLGEKEEETFLEMLRGEILEGDIVICSGLPMNGMRTDIYRRVSGICGEKGARCMLDANRQYLKGALPGRYFFAKPNLDELAKLFDAELPQNDEEVAALGERLLNQGVEQVLISLGRAGGFFISRTRQFRIRVPQIPVISTIGSGDASVAGFCIGAVRGMDEEGCARLAMACGVCNAQNRKVGCVEKDQVEYLSGQMKVETYCEEIPFISKEKPSA